VIPPHLLCSLVDAQYLTIVFLLLDLLEYLAPHGLNMHREREELLLGQLVLRQVLFGDDAACSSVLKYGPPRSGIRLGLGLQGARLLQRVQVIVYIEGRVV
jgi:hypothetical protein